MPRSISKKQRRPKKGPKLAMALKKQKASIANSKHKQTRRGSGSRVDATEDRGDLPEKIGLVSDYLAAWRVWCQIHPWQLPEKTKTQILSVLLKDPFYVSKLKVETTPIMLAAAQKETAQIKKAVRQQFITALHHPPSPPASLKEHMTRESLESVVYRYQTSSRTHENIISNLREARKSRTLFRKGGAIVRRIRSQLMVLLTKATSSQRKAAKFTEAILEAWHPAIAPASAKSVRISSIQQTRNTTLRNQ